MSHVQRWEMPDRDYYPEFEKDDVVLRAVPPRGIPERFTIAEGRWNRDKGCHEYKLVDKQGKPHEEKDGTQLIDWFEEETLDHA